jgi:cytochrome c oxidase subunit 1
VLFGGSIFGLLAAAYYWFPKMTGRMMDEKLGKINFWTTFVGFNATFFPMHFLGLAGMPRRYYTYGEASGWSFWNLVVSCGAFFLGGSILLFVYNLGKSLRDGEIAGPNPWDAPTPEWMIPSPPPEYNFAVIPNIRHRDPIWWDKYGGHDPHADSEELHATDEAHAHERAVNERGVAEGPIHMPNPSYYPAMAALGFFIGALGLLFDGPTLTIGLVHLPFVCIVGTVILFVALYGWAFEPAS